jgi:hypothetical protein
MNNEDAMHDEHDNPMMHDKPMGTRSGSKQDEEGHGQGG